MAMQDILQSGHWKFVDRAALSPVIMASGSTQRLLQILDNGVRHTNSDSSSGGWSLMGFPRRPTDDRHATILMWAAASLNISMINRVLDASAPVHARDHHGRTAMHYAALPFKEADVANVADCMSLLRASSGGKDYPCDLEVPDRFDNMPLRMSLSPSHPSDKMQIPFFNDQSVRKAFVEAFLPEENSKRTWRAQEYIGRALEHALTQVDTRVCQPDIITLLCDRGASFVFENAGVLDNVIQVAVFNEVPEQIISILLEKGANKIDDTFWSPFLIAADRKAPAAIVESILNHGADPALATRNCDTDAARMVLQYLQKLSRSGSISLTASKIKTLKDTIDDGRLPTKWVRAWFKW